MKVLGILGSPRKGGNTEILLNRTLEAANKSGADVELIRLSDKKISPCNGCNACMMTGDCSIEDDMQDISVKIQEAGGIVFATPVYAWTMTGQMKVFLDRTYALSFKRENMAGKVGGSIVVGGRQGHQLTQSLFYMYFSAAHWIAADWVNGFAWGKGEILKDKHAMQAAHELGEQIVLLIKQGFKFPEKYDQPIYRHVVKEYKISLNPTCQG